MQFFSSYSYIWRFQRQQEDAYEQYCRKKDIQFCRLFLYSLAAITALFLLVDSTRPVIYFYVLVFRGGLILTLLSLAAMTYAFRLPPRRIQALVFIAFIISYAAYISLSTLAQMPPFVLPNVFLLLMYMAMTFSGLRFRISLVMNVSVFAVYVINARYAGNLYHQSQLANLAANVVLSAIAGAFIESDKRTNYLQFAKLLGQKNELDELNQQKSKIISILSHDIAAPLRSLSGLLEMYKGSRMTKSEFDTFMPEVQSRLNNASVLVHSLVRWSKSQIAGFTAERVQVDMGQLVNENIALSNTQATEKNITFAISATHECIVLADLEMVRLIIRNLISNAVKFSFPDKVIQIDITSQANDIALTISNEGNGIAPETAEKLFSYQVVSVNGTANEKGTGLGLAVAQHFASLNDGKIHMDSGDKITTFRLVLPKAQALSFQ